MSPFLKTHNVSVYILINKDNKSLEAYRARRQRDKEMDTLKDDVSSLKNDLQEIKDLLKGLVK